MKIKIHFVPRDLWIGVYVPKAEELQEHVIIGSIFKSGDRYTSIQRIIYICILPMLPIVIQYKTKQRRKK